MSNKSYVVDTNILIEDKNCIVNLRNGEENNIYIPNTVMEELDHLKDKKPQLKPRIFQVLGEIDKYKDDIEILFAKNLDIPSPDNKIINEILSNIHDLQSPIFITNDKILRFKAYKKGITTEEYKTQIPFKHESEEYTGFVDLSTEEKIDNCFY